MAEKTHFDILKQGVEYWNQWRRDNPLVKPDLSEADLKKCSIGGIITSKFARIYDDDRQSFTGVHVNFGDPEVNLKEANLSGADLTEAHIRAGDFRAANLAGANLTGAFLEAADLSFARLEETDLSRANLYGVHLSGAFLFNTNFSGALMGFTTLNQVDLRRALALETVQHRAPSNIGIETIFRSKGRIPVQFLRGAGVPEIFIEYMHSLVGTALSYHSCFISYSSQDQEFTERLHADLQGKGVRCWFAPKDLKIGDKFRPAFDDAIHMHDKLMVVLSTSSVKSAWVEKEVETAFEKEHQQRRPVLLPIRLDDAIRETKEAWAADIRRTRHIGDFRNWKDRDSYQKAFDRLLRDLKAESHTESAKQE